MWSEIYFVLQILMKLEFSWQFFKRLSNIKFHENLFSGSRVVPCRQTDGVTDMTKLIVTFHNFANTPKNSEHYGWSTFIVTQYPCCQCARQQADAPSRVLHYESMQAHLWMSKGPTTWYARVITIIVMWISKNTMCRLMNKEGLLYCCQQINCEIWGGHTGVTWYSGLLDYYAVLTGI